MFRALPQTVGLTRRFMSKQVPKITGQKELSAADARQAPSIQDVSLLTFQNRWITLKKIDWQDEDGKPVRPFADCIQVIS